MKTLVYVQSTSSRAFQFIWFRRRNKAISFVNNINNNEATLTANIVHPHYINLK